MSAHASDRIVPTRRPRIATLLCRTLIAWGDRRRQRLDLAELDDRLLRDIGVTRQEARRECAKWFWSMSPESGNRFRNKDMRKNKNLKRVERI